MFLTHEEQLAQSSRMERNNLLAETDIVVLRAYESGTEVPQEWKDYRQALRDITTHSKFPSCFPWPNKPE
jgi:hypothetical protein